MHSCCSQLDLLRLWLPQLSLARLRAAAAANESAGVAYLEEKTLPIGVIRRGLFYPSAEGFLFFMSATMIIRGVGFSLSVSGHLQWVFFRLLRAIPVEVASPAPHTARGLSAVGPDMTLLLTVKAMSQTSLSSVGLNPDDDMAQVGQFKYFHCFLISRARHEI